MFDYLKKAFTNSSGEDVIQHMLERSRERSKKFIEIGQQIADDCVETGLRNGKFTTLSDMENHIRSKHLHKAEVVLNGFLMRIQEYVSADEVVNVSIDNGDVLLAHKDHVADILKKLHSGENLQAIRVSSESEQNDRDRDIKSGQEALAREIAFLLSDISNSTSEIAKFLEGILPAARAIELIAQRKGDRMEPSSGWTISASLSYSGGTRQGFIRVDDPKLVSFLQLDNPKVYIQVSAKKKKLFGEGDIYGGYFSFSYFLHSGDIESKQNEFNKEHMIFVKDILLKFNVPTSLPELLQRAGCLDLAQKWMAIAQHS